MNRVSLLIPIMLMFAVSFAQAQSSAPCTEETEERNKQLARRFYEKVWFSNEPVVVDEIFAPEYVIHDIGDVKGLTEKAGEQTSIAGFFWENGTMSGSIDYQIADCDLVATRWQWRFEPETWWLKLLNGRDQIPIINVFRFKDGKIVEVWNHRHDIDTMWGNVIFAKGLLIGLAPSLVFLALNLFLWRKLRRQKR